MKRILLLLVMAAIAVVDISAQHEVRITTKDGTTEIPLDEISSISVADELWSGWAPIEGHETGTYYMSLYTALEFPDTVFYREHMLDETKAQFMFRFTLIGAKEDLIVDYNKETNECQVGIHDFIDHPTYGPVFLSDLPNNPFDLNGDGLRETYEDNPCTFDPETGTFTLNLIYFVLTDFGSSASGTFGYGEETAVLDGFKQYDYSFSMVFDGKHTEQGENKEYAVFNIVKGADISKYLFHVVEESNDLDATIAGMANNNGEWKLDLNNMQPIETTAAKAPAMRFEGGRKLSICNNAKRVLRTVEVKKSKSIPAEIKSTEGFDPTIIEE